MRAVLRGRRWLFLVAGGVALLLLLVGWTRVSASSRFCASCHDMGEATRSASSSVHADVSCLSCHRRPGAIGAIEYLPTLAVETVEAVTGWNTARHVLPAAPCVSCHGNLTTVSAEGAHPDAGSDCASCHGSVAHPESNVPPAEPHPVGFDLTHGREAAVDAAACTQCHQAEFCRACHARVAFPHPSGWLESHGGVQEELGADACTLCHAPTYCKGCHGTEIPHRATWLGEHYRALAPVSEGSCYTCHAPVDCTSCHSRHADHRQQGLDTAGG